MCRHLSAILDCLALAAPRDLARLGRYLGIRVPSRPLSMVEHADLLQAVRDRSMPRPPLRFAVRRDNRPPSLEVL